MQQLINLFFLYQLLFSNCLFAQNKVICKDFLLNKASFARSDIYLTNFERALGKIKNAPIILERNDSTLQLLMNVVQNEKNFQNKPFEKFEIPIADFYISCNVEKEGFNERFILYVDFINISNRNLFAKNSLAPIIFSTKIFDDDVAFYEFLKKELERQIVFDDKLGFLNTEQNNRLDTIKKEIDYLKKNNETLNNDIDSLKESVKGVNLYSEWAKYDILGNNGIVGGKGVTITSGLINSMDKIFMQFGTSDTIKLRKNCSIEKIEMVIKNFPCYPFGYFAACLYYYKKRDRKWMDYLIKMNNILYYTTQIQPHNPNHDQVYSMLSSFVIGSYDIKVYNAILENFEK